MRLERRPQQGERRLAFERQRDERVRIARRVPGLARELIAPGALVVERIALPSALVGRPGLRLAGRLDAARLGVAGFLLLPLAVAARALRVLRARRLVARCLLASGTAPIGLLACHPVALGALGLLALPRLAL